MICMKRFFSFAFVILVGLSGYAQEMTVKNFEEATNDMAARTSPQKDGNDIPCALIKVYIAVADAQFSGTVVHSEMKAPSEYWVYVAHNTKRLHINATGYTPIDVVFADYGIDAVAKLTTYKLTIEVPQLANKPKVITEQYVEFTVEPKNAMVEFDGKVVPLDDYGTASIYKHFGKYSYRVTANLYHSQQGEVVVNDPNNAHRVPVLLQPAFGYIKVPDTDSWKGATVYINDEMKGTTPFTSDKLPSGIYKVRVVREMYSSEEQELVVRDGETVAFSKPLKPQFMTLTLSAKDKETEIWVNGKKYSVGKWIGDLGFGSYKVECKKANHRTAETTLNVTSDMITTIDLPSPTPITGELILTSTPSNADIFLDGEKVGATPKRFPNILIGNHNIELRKEGMASVSRRITIKEGKTDTLSLALSPSVYSSPYGTNAQSESALAALLQHPLGMQQVSWNNTMSEQIQALVSQYPMMRPNDDHIVFTGYSIPNAPRLCDKQLSYVQLDYSNVIYNRISVVYKIRATSYSDGQELAERIRREMNKYGIALPALDTNGKSTKYNCLAQGVYYNMIRLYNNYYEVELSFTVNTAEETAQTTFKETATTSSNTKKHSAYYDYYADNGNFVFNWAKTALSAEFSKEDGDTTSMSFSLALSAFEIRYKWMGLDLCNFRLRLNFYDLHYNTYYWEPQLVFNIPMNQGLAFVASAGPSLCFNPSEYNKKWWFTTTAAIRWDSGVIGTWDVIVGYKRGFFLGISIAIPHKVN
mgnify:CR=1 FL=1